MGGWGEKNFLLKKFFFFFFFLFFGGCVFFPCSAVLDFVLSVWAKKSAVCAYFLASTAPPHSFARFTSLKSVTYMSLVEQLTEERTSAHRNASRFSGTTHESPSARLANRQIGMSFASRRRSQ